MCDFSEPYFGASYPDACCIDGFLWDLDSCYEPGGPLTRGGDDPCPQCNREAWLESFKDKIEDEGHDAAFVGKPRLYIHESVKWEQSTDRATIEAWWLAGYDQFKPKCADCSSTSEPKLVDLRVPGKVNRWQDRPGYLCCQCRKSRKGEWRYKRLPNQHVQEVLAL